MRRTTWERSLKNWELQISCFEEFWGGENVLGLVPASNPHALGYALHFLRPHFPSPKPLQGRLADILWVLQNSHQMSHQIALPKIKKSATSFYKSAGRTVRENQTCTELRSTISRHLLPPISRWGKRVDSYRKFCRNSRTSHRNRVFSGTGKRQIPLGEKGGKGDTKR